MKIKWLVDCQLEMVTAFDEKNEETTTEDVFPKAGEIEDVDPIAYHKSDDIDGSLETVALEYAHGCIYGIPCSLFEILEGREEMEACN